MIVSYSRGFVFLKTRKTGSSSIQVALAGLCGEGDIIVGSRVDRTVFQAFTRNPHATLRQMRVGLPPGLWNGFLKIAFVRNPWDLVVSRYHWDMRGVECSVEDFRRWLPAYMDPDLAEPERNGSSSILTRRWEAGGGYVNDLQSPFVVEAGRTAVEFVGRYERLAEDFGEVCRRLGAAPPPLPHLKGGFRPARTWESFYDAPARRLVEAGFAEDIEHFRYAFR